MLKFIDVYTSLCYTFLNKIIEISDKIPYKMLIFQLNCLLKFFK